MKKNPEQVLKSLRVYFKINNVRRKEIAKVLHYKTEQTVSNLFNSKKYLNEVQAELLRKAYGLNPLFLTKGKGELMETPNLKFITEEDAIREAVKNYLKAINILKNLDSISNHLATINLLPVYQQYQIITEILLNKYASN